MQTAAIENSLLAEAAEWRLIGLLFECPSGNWQKDIVELAEEISDTDLKTAAASAIEEGAEGIYHSTFGPGGPAPPREVSYRSWVQPGYLLSELSAFYSAFSYHPSIPDAPDHIAVETGFVSYLRLKQAYAELTNDKENVELTADASRKFISEHIVKIAEPLAKSLEFSGVSYLAQAAKCLFDRVGKDADEAKRKSLPILPTAEEDFFDCADAAGEIDI